MQLKFYMELIAKHWFISLCAISFIGTIINNILRTIAHIVIARKEKNKENEI